jgi:signal transduction histidine kinase
MPAYTPSSAAASWRLLALAGVVTASAVFVSGLTWERLRFGSTDAETLVRVEAAVRADVDRRAAMLRLAAEGAQRDPALGEALARRGAAVSTVFRRLPHALGHDPSIALTIYAIDGTPLAWVGRPSSLPRERLDGPAALFVAPGALGLRLVYLVPVTFNAVSGGGSVRGAVVAESVLSATRGLPGAVDAGHTIDVLGLPVEVRPRFGGAGARGGNGTFLVRSSSDEVLLEARLAPEQVREARGRWRHGVRGATAVAAALSILVLLVPVVDWRRHARRPAGVIVGTAVALALVVAARLVAWWALPESWRMRTGGGSPLDFALTALALAATGLLTLELVTRARAWLRASRSPSVAAAAPVQVALWQLAAGAAVLGLALLFHGRLDDVVRSATTDVMHLSLHPWEPRRLLLMSGLIILHAVQWWTATVVLVLAATAWRVCHPDWRRMLVVSLLWIAPAAGLLIFRATVEQQPLQYSLGLAVGGPVLAAWAWVLRGNRWRRGSQAMRLTAAALALIVPSLALYPLLVHAADVSRRLQIETRFARQAMDYPEELQRRLQDTQSQVDAMPGLADTVSALEPASIQAQTDTAFAVWQQTTLAERRLTSAVELYGPSGQLVSRFALNFPEYGTGSARWLGASCEWETFGEAAPFGAEERRMLHAERGLCDAQRRIVGAVVVHVMPDYGALPFLSSQGPYYEILRRGVEAPGEAATAANVGLVIYGWGRTPLYSSTGRAWILGDDVFRQIYASRRPFWSLLSVANARHHVYFSNDRFGIYAVDYPALGIFDHLVHLAEMATFAGLLFVLLLAAWRVVLRLAWHRGRPGRLLIREIRTSFYRKLFLGFVAAAVVPVLILAVSTRAYVAGRLRSDIEAEASRTAAVARRMIEESLALQQTGTLGLPALDDDLLVWLSRVIDQDVNVFEGAQLVATSERDLFASGLLPTRIPDGVYRAIVLDRSPSYVAEDEIGGLRFLTAATPLRATGRDSVLTVPLGLRQRDIEREIDELDRGVQLGALAFILLGAAMGFWMAERIGDPVQRLTRAARRIASGDLDARVLVRSADELKRLVEAFNGMAEDLQRQRTQLERTNRLEAWAEMARQVAHDIKNPLTPIQLSAEHVRRVHRDQGRPLGAVVDNCVDAILAQVRLLRQMASEFSSFATTPVPELAPTSLGEVVGEVTSAYAVGLGERIRLRVDVPPDLPPLMIDKVLVARALTNVIENALHAMPEGGDLRVSAAPEAGAVEMRVTDTGLGMDDESVARVFEPYFSTKAIGTGLGLTIAKRNIEVQGGTIVVSSRKGAGTVVAIRLPLAGPSA